jgi:hypothetical protein
MTKEICKLFSKKFSIDVAEGMYIESDLTKITIASTVDYIGIHIEVFHWNIDLEAMLFPVFGLTLWTSKVVNVPSPFAKVRNPTHLLIYDE